jgi:ABC-type transport system involved in cytochrome bd biosynthesis fused ATPase/permease subunit
MKSYIWASSFFLIGDFIMSEAVEKTTNHVGYILMLFVGVPLIGLVLFAAAFGLVGPAAIVLVPIILFFCPLAVIVCWIVAAVKTRKHNALVAMTRHQEMMRAIASAKAHSGILA